MKIAIFGASGSGKSAVSDKLARRLNIELRGCGDEVKRLAKDKGVPFLCLTESDHASIDSQTVDFATQNDDWIIEGRFLDQVLGELDRPFLLIKLEATAETRAGRLEKRDSRVTTIDDVYRYDAEDEAFRIKIYPGWTIKKASHAIQCDMLSVEDVLDEILALIEG